MLSREFLIKRKQCCGNGCFMCPYLPRHKKGSIDLNLNLGYACQNMQLSHLGKGKRVTMNRSCIKKTYTEKGALAHGRTNLLDMTQSFKTTEHSDILSQKKLTADMVGFWNTLLINIAPP